MADDRPKIAFLGIGLMGAPQARNLLKAGYALTAWNRTATKAEALAADGATIAATPKAAGEAADVAVLMLERGEVVEDVLFGAQGAAEELKRGALVIDMSSIHPDQARNHAARLAEKGVAYLDAPVSGGTVGAREATLTIFAGGSREAFARGEPVLKAMGRPNHMGDVGAGQASKLANQMIVASTITAVAEALLFARKAGVDAAKLQQALRGGFADSRILELHGKRMIDRDFEPGGRTTMQLKDLENCVSSASQSGFEAPVLGLVTALFRDLLAHEGDVDHAGVFLAIERRNGMKPA